MANKANLFDRGQRNILDALFIRSAFIPIAKRAQHWNIVVFESYRIIELIIKGIICIYGNGPKETHQLKPNIDKLRNILQGQNLYYPFAYAWVGKHKNCYGVNIVDGVLRFYKRVNHEYTIIGSGRKIAVDSGEDPEICLTRSGPNMSITINNTMIMEVTDSSTGPQPLIIKRRFRLADIANMLATLCDVGEELHVYREDAFYSTIVYSKTDAIKSLGLLDTAMSAATNIVNVEG